jgi:hypothetical protein
MVSSSPRTLWSSPTSGLSVHPSGHVRANGTRRAILHNPEDYPEPDEFKPERYLKQGIDGEYEIDKSVRDPRAAVFGFGRRCVHQ